MTVYFDRLARARSDLDDIADWLSELYADREKGTPRHWAEGKRTEIEGPFGPPGATAPARLDVLDRLVDLQVSIRELVDAVCDRLDRSGPALPAGDRPEAVLRSRLTWLRAQLPAVGDNDDLAEHVEDEAGRLVRAVRRATGQLLPIQTLRLTCPLCDGVSRLAANHNTGRIACADCGIAWSDNVSGVGLGLVAPTYDANGLCKDGVPADHRRGRRLRRGTSENIRDWQRSGHVDPAGKRGLSNTYRSADVLGAC